MRVFKFGGASVRDSRGIKNLGHILKMNGSGPMVVVVSAMGKTTNRLENILLSSASLQREKEISAFYDYHVSIIEDLQLSECLPYVEKAVSYIRERLNSGLGEVELYNSIVSQGELLSSTIVQRYLLSAEIPAQWIDARKYVITDYGHAEARVDWKISSENISKLTGILQRSVVVTQGFIGGTTDGRTTTLGREGSDFSAAIFASCLNAESVTVWKDVNGIMNGDPKRFPDTITYKELSYSEAAEMTYYGAKVIHPKTIKPLANRKIPLMVKSFFEPNEQGTLIHDCEVADLVPAVIVKDGQSLISFHVRDFTFINEKNLHLIFHEISEADMKISLMQNSAISLSVIMDDHPDHLDHIIQRLKPHFTIKYNTGLELFTIKNYTPAFIERFKKDRKILLEQVSRNNYRAVMFP